MHLLKQGLEYRTIILYPGLKGQPGHLGIGSSVRTSVRWSVHNYVPLTNKVQYLKVGWSYTNQTWTVSSSKCCSHFTDITCPWGGRQRGENVGLRDFAIFWLYCRLGHLCFINTCLVDIVTLTFDYSPKTFIFMRRHFTINILSNTMWNLNLYLHRIKWYHFGN